MRATRIYLIAATLMVLINNHVQAQEALISTPADSSGTTVVSPLSALSTTATTLNSIVIVTSTSPTSTPSTSTSTTSTPLTSTSTPSTSTSTTSTPLTSTSTPSTSTSTTSTPSTSTSTTSTPLTSTSPTSTPSTSTSTPSTPPTPITTEVPGTNKTSTPHPSPATTPIPFPVINTTINFPSNEGKWRINFTSTQNRSCIIVQGALQLTFSEEIPSGRDTTTSLVDVPIEALAVGNCDDGHGVSTLTLLWSTVEDKAWMREDSLEFTFALKENGIDGESYEVSNLTFAYAVFKHNSTARVEESSRKMTADGPFFETKLNSSYLCTTYQSYQRAALSFETEFFQIEAFRSEYLDSVSFNKAKICIDDMNATATVIGIVIGSILAFLVSVSLGAYLGTRYGYFRWPFCNRADGYSRLDI